MAPGESSVLAGCSYVRPSAVRGPGRFLARVEIFAKNPSTNKAVHICSVYYAGDTD